MTRTSSRRTAARRPSHSPRRTASAGARVRARASSSGVCLVLGPEKTQVEARLPQPRRELPPRVEASLGQRRELDAGDIRQRSATTEGGQERFPACVTSSTS